MLCDEHVVLIGDDDDDDGDGDVDVVGARFGLDFMCVYMSQLPSFCRYVFCSCVCSGVQQQQQTAVYMVCDS